MKRALLTAAAILMLSIPASADFIYCQVTLTMTTANHLHARGYVEYAVRDDLIDTDKNVDIYLTIVGTSASWTGVTTTPYSTPLLEGGTATPPNCYIGRITATSVTDSTVWSSASSGSDICLQGPPPPSSCSTLAAYCSECDPSHPCVEPIVINLGNGSYAFSGLDKAVMFDFFGSGIRTALSWTETGSDVAFLARDLNRNLMIDNGTELFGNVTRLRDGSYAANGFMALAELDDNHDGQVDARDTGWSSLMLWVDRDHDGISQPAELLPLRETEIVSLGLTYHWTGRRDSSGNMLGFQALVRERERTRPYYDVFFSFISH